MNTQLYNSLISAKEFLITVEKNEKDLQHRKSKITGTYFNPYVLSPKDQPKKFSWVKFYLLLCLDGLGIIYAIYIYCHNRKSKKKQEYLDKLSNSPEELSRKKAALEESENLRIEYEKKLAEYKKYYSENYWNKLGFLPDWARKIETVDVISYRIEYIDGLIHYVKRGAKTLNEAMELYGKELREIEAIKEQREEQREYQKRMEVQHQKEIDALNTIAKNQEKANDELEKLRREYVDRW